MDCNYMLREEFFEDYILDRINPEDKAEFEIHLKSCDTCQERLRDENELIASIRSIGVKEMKLEIQRLAEVHRAQNQKTDWTLVVKVAAVMFFLVLMPGVLYLINFQYSAEKSFEMDPLIAVDYYNEPLHRMERKKEASPDAELVIGSGPAGRDDSDNQLLPPADGNIWSDFSDRAKKEKGKTSPEVDKETESIKSSQIGGQPVEEAAGLVKDESVSDLGALKLLEKQASAPVNEDEITAAGKSTASQERNYRLGYAEQISRRDESVIKDIKKSAPKGIEVMINRTNGSTRILNFKSDKLMDHMNSRAWPDSFRVEIVKSDSLEMKMKWILDPDILVMWSEPIEVLEKDDKLDINFGLGIKYIAELNKMELWAVLTKAD